jgi:hypothetical protein
LLLDERDGQGHRQRRHGHDDRRSIADRSTVRRSNAMASADERRTIADARRTTNG